MRIDTLRWLFPGQEITFMRLSEWVLRAMLRPGEYAWDWRGDKDIRRVNPVDKTIVNCVALCKGTLVVDFPYRKITVFEPNLLKGDKNNNIG